MKILNELLERIDFELITGDLLTEVKGIVLDSRIVEEGFLFVARKGEKFDGHEYIEKAMGLGARAVMGEKFSLEQVEMAKQKHVCLLKVRDSALVGGVVVAGFYDFPFLKMQLIGITGTDGKTTTTSAIYGILKSLGKKVGLISTVSAMMFNGETEFEMETGLHVTTPEVTEIQSLLSQMVEKGCEYAVVECTSHGFAQERLAGINFDVVGVTNITHEHTDYHKTIENYIAAKGKIFRIDETLPSKVGKRLALVNGDDEKSRFLEDYAKEWEIRRFSLEGRGILNAENVKLGIDGSEFELNSNIKFKTGLVGRYNVANLVLAMGVCHALGFGLEEMATGVAKLQSPPGRFEVIDGGEHGQVVIDFAHTPHAMEEVMSFVRNHIKGKLIVVFGCAGLRDVGKREMMGRIAGRLAELAIVTAEDPRMESIGEICEMIERGLKQAGSVRVQKFKIQNSKSEINYKLQITNYKFGQFDLGDGYCFVRIEDRAEAIRFGIGVSGKNDVVMVLGKGHERSMCFGTEEVEWSDREAIAKCLGNSE